MPKQLINRILSRGILLLLVIWGSASFFLFMSPTPVKISVVALTAICIYFIFSGKGNLILLYFIIFGNFYALYGLLFTYNLPPYLLIIALATASALIFYYLGRKIDDFKDFPLALVFFVILNIEIFLALSFLLINPLTRSMIMVIVIYILSGFWFSIKDQSFDLPAFKGYLYVGFITLAVILLTVTWGH